RCHVGRDGRRRVAVGVVAPPVDRARRAGRGVPRVTPRLGARAATPSLRRMSSGFPDRGRPVDDVVADLAGKRTDDVRWRDGRTFGLVFNGGPDVHAVAEQAAVMYLHDNALNPFAFPSLLGIEQEVVDWTA